MNKLISLFALCFTLSVDAFPPFMGYMPMMDEWNLNYPRPCCGHYFYPDFFIPLPWHGPYESIIDRRDFHPFSGYYYHRGPFFYLDMYEPHHFYKPILQIDKFEARREHPNIHFYFYDKDGYDKYGSDKYGYGSDHGQEINYKKMKHWNLLAEGKYDYHPHKPTYDKYQNKIRHGDKYDYSKIKDDKRLNRRMHDKYGSRDKGYEIAHRCHNMGYKYDGRKCVDHSNDYRYDRTNLMRYHVVSLDYLVDEDGYDRYGNDKYGYGSDNESYEEDNRRYGKSWTAKYDMIRKYNKDLDKYGYDKHGITSKWDSRYY